MNERVKPSNVSNTFGSQWSDTTFDGPMDDLNGGESGGPFFDEPPLPCHTSVDFDPPPCDDPEQLGFVCQHHHETMNAEDGTEMLHCVHTHTRDCPNGIGKAKQNNRRAVQRYRAKKKAEVESLREENKALKEEVKTLRELLVQKGTTIVSSEEREELEMLREQLAEIRAILSIKKE